MPIEFACSACNKPLRVADEVAGKIAKCPHCDAQMQVPVVSQHVGAPRPGHTENPFAGPAATTTKAPAGSSGTITLRRVDVASCALMLGALYAVIGLIIGVGFGVLAAIGAAAGPGGGVEAIGGGLIMAILFPILNGIGGLVGGALVALLYNLLAKFVGGIKFDI